MATLNDNDWRVLIDSIKAGTCVPVLGAGVNDGLLPTGGRVARALAEHHAYPMPDSDDLMRVAEYLAVIGSPMAPKREVLEMLKQELSRQDGTPQFATALGADTRPLATLARLPFHVYVTTNYDDLLTRALRLRNRNPQRDFCRWNSWLRKFRPAAALSEPTERNPLVYHLHGSDEEERSVVLTEDDYLDFLSNMTKWPDMVPPRVQEALSGTLLFMGYRLADWTFRTLLRSIQREIDESVRDLSVAIQLTPEDARPGGTAWIEYLEKYYLQMKIRVFWGNADEFSTSLLRYWNAR